MKALGKFIALPLVVGIISALFTMNSMKAFEMLNKPVLSPPGWLFPVVWTILYILMGISSYLIYNSSASQKEKSEALTVYLIQLALNFLWPTFFFTFSWYWYSLIWLLVLWVAVAIMILKFYKISKPAAYLNIPYIIWLTFAAYLNYAIAVMN
ncbi:MAG: tryptophan-rich sensory protein [Lachnospiraceae bacterium]|nr:tryptophan-rich sensory protein [Lachnospiraceae bacterium]